MGGALGKLTGLQNQSYVEFDSPAACQFMGPELVWSFQRTPEERKNLVRFQEGPPKQ